MEKDCNININVEICILITEEEFAERERYYEELYASGGNIEKSSEGFSTEGGAPKFVRKIGEKLGFSVSEIIDENNNSYGMGVILDSTLLENLTPEERVEMVKERVKELGGQVFTAYDNNGNAVDVTVAEPKRKFKNKSGKKTNANIHLTNYNRNLVKQEAVVLIDELITTASFKGTEPAKHPHDWLDNNGKNEWDVWETYIQDKNKTIWKAKLRIANTIDGEKFYTMFFQ